MNKHIYTWPKNPNGTFKSLGDMNTRDLVHAEGSVHQARRRMDLTTIIVNAFLERQVAIAMENLALGRDID